MLPLALVFILLSSGCVSKDPQQVVNSATAKSDSMNSYSIDYDMDVSLAGTTVSGTSTMQKKGDRIRSDSTMAMLGMKVTTSNFEIPEGSFTCTAAFGKSVCNPDKKNSGSPVMTPGKSAEMLSDFVKKGVVTMKYVNSPVIAGEQCDNISFSFDPARLSQVAAEMGTTQSNARSPIKSFVMSSCYGVQTGLPLQVMMDMTFSGDLQALGMSVSMTATSFRPNAVIEDFVFALPSEPIAGNGTTDEPVECETPANCVDVGLCENEGNCTCENGICYEVPKIIGGEQDEHGCVLAAGYSWCGEKQKCVRPWEEPCIITQNFTNFTCAREGEKFSIVFKDEYPEKCCSGLTEWLSGFDTRVSVGSNCYDTDLDAGNPVGTCLDCGNGVCDSMENPCNCAADCTAGKNADYATVAAYCASTYPQMLAGTCAYSNMSVCGLCA